MACQEKISIKGQKTLLPDYSRFGYCEGSLWRNHFLIYQVMTKYIISLLFITGILILLSVVSKVQTKNPIYRIAKIKVDGNKLEQYKSALQELEKRNFKYLI